jgi:hypothetical protein
MPPVDARRIISCNFIPWLGGHCRFRSVIPPHFSAYLRAIQLVFHFRQVCFGLPSYLDLCHRAANLVIGHRQEPLGRRKAPLEAQRSRSRRTQTC